MTTKPEQADIRPLAANEIDETSGGLTLRAFGYELDIISDGKRLHVWAGTYNADGSGRSVRII